MKSIRILQREGKVLVAEDFTPLAPKTFGQRAASATGVRTKTDLKLKRRQESTAELMTVYGDLQNPKQRVVNTYERP